MNSRLNHIKNWEELAEGSNYSSKELARRCNVSLRHLERFFMATRRKLPHHWLNEYRLQKARELMCAGRLVKEVAAYLGYKQAAHFSRAFKRYHGASPARIEDDSAQMSLLGTGCRF
jgi:transcriptional regulator GlxA family with amidase domain